MEMSNPLTVERPMRMGDSSWCSSHCQTQLSVCVSEEPDGVLSKLVYTVFLEQTHFNQLHYTSTCKYMIYSRFGVYDVSRSEYGDGFASKGLYHVLWEAGRMSSALGSRRRDAFSQAFWYEQGSRGARMKEVFLFIILHPYITSTLEGGKKRYLIPGEHSSGEEEYYWYRSRNITLLFHVSVFIAR